MKYFLFITKFLIASLSLSSAFAEDAPQLNDGKAKKKPIVLFKKAENHSFSGLKLKGQMKKPEISYIYKRKGIRSEKIIAVPENFDNDIVQGSGKF